MTLFSAFDHFKYCKLFAQNLAVLLCMLHEVMQYFQMGAFVVSITCKAWHSVGVIEAHEMMLLNYAKHQLFIPAITTLKDLQATCAFPII